MQHNKRNHGFSLLELAIAVATLITMIVTLIPAVRQARNYAVSSACQTNQRILGIAYSQYIETYGQIPGLNYMEGTYWSKPWGSMYFYGGLQAWMTNGDDFWRDYLYGYGVQDEKPSGLSGMGHVYPFIEGDGRLFYCPGTAASFTASAGANYTWYEGHDAWYSTWTGIPDTGYNGFGKQGRGTITTYFYRGGAYARDVYMPDADPRWANGYSTDPNYGNWTTCLLSRPSSPWTHNTPIMTCFWFGYREDSTQPTWTPLPPDTSMMPHDGQSVNLLYDDGSSRTWLLPTEIVRVNVDGSITMVYKPLSAIWGWFGAGAWTIDQLSTGSMQDGFTIGYPGDFYTQAPYWWVAAQRGVDGR